MLVAVIMQDLDDRAPAKEFLAATRKVDSRLYFVESHCQGVDIQSEWEVEMRGGESIWEKAIRYTRAWDERNLPGGL